MAGREGGLGFRNLLNAVLKNSEVAKLWLIKAYLVLFYCSLNTKFVQRIRIVSFKNILA